MNIVALGCDRAAAVAASDKLTTLQRQPRTSVFLASYIRTVHLLIFQNAYLPFPKLDIRQRTNRCFCAQPAVGVNMHLLARSADLGRNRLALSS